MNKRHGSTSAAALGRHPLHAVVPSAHRCRGRLSRADRIADKDGGRVGHAVGYRVVVAEIHSVAEKRATEHTVRDSAVEAVEQDRGRKLQRDDCTPTGARQVLPALRTRTPAARKAAPARHNRSRHQRS